MNAILSEAVKTDLVTFIRHYLSITPKYIYKEMCNIINNHHKIPITVRKVKYICNKQKLQRTTVDNNLLKECILNEIQTSRSCVGYRQMSEIISLKYGINVSREKVRLALKALDPEGVAERGRTVIKRRIYETKGPHEVYHIDGNDKLKMWGFYIHGAVDGFSRKILWLKIATTNKDPLVIANFYLNCVKSYMIAPRLLRMDKGTENIYLEDLQVLFTDNVESFRYGASVRNQRIEAFWARLKKFCLSWWKRFFQQMFHDGIYRADLETHKETLIFCFLPVVQKELNEVVQTWNARNVRQSSSAPGGKPEILFNLPETIGFSKQGSQVDADTIRTAEETIGIDHHPVWINKDLHELLKCYLHIHKLSMPTNADDALELYATLLGILGNDNFVL